MAVLTPLSNLDMRAVLQRYALGELERHWPAAEGIENTNYFVRVRSAAPAVSGAAGSTPANAPGKPAREYVLTVLENNAAPADVLLPVLTAAADAGLPVAAPLADRGGQFVTQVAGKPALLAPRLSGAHPEQTDAAQCAAVGRFLARFHRACGRLADTAPPHPRNGGWLARRAHETRLHLGWGEREQLIEAVTACRQLLGRTDVHRLPYGVVHADLFRDNALVSGQNLTGVLDFHHASRAPLVFDLAVTINDWCVTDARTDPARAWALLRAYDATRPLRAEELWLLPAFLVLAATAFWLSRLDVQVRAAHGTPAKPPAEMATLVRSLLGHPPVFDPRLLLRAA